VNDFVEAAGVVELSRGDARYAELLAVFRKRIAATVDFDRVEPREFWRARRARGSRRVELRRESSDRCDCSMRVESKVPASTMQKSSRSTFKCLAQMIQRESNPECSRRRR